MVFVVSSAIRAVNHAFLHVVTGIGRWFIIEYPCTQPGRLNMKYWLIICLVISGCATAPPAGVRSGYQAARVSKISVAPTFSLDSFGLDSHERNVIERSVDQDAVIWLRRAGFEVNSPAHLRTQLAEEWNDVEDAWYRGVELDSLFEQGAPEFEGAEIAAAQRASKHLDAQHVLLIQVLYQTDSVCREDAQQFTPYAITEPPAATAYPCVISHLEAKLVDARTGQIMWHNRAFVELAADPSPTARRQSLGEAVDWLLGSSTGLLSLRSMPVESAP